MSWEIQGQVESAADLDALFDNPTEAPSDAEDKQTDALHAALSTLVTAGVVGGPIHVRAGGHANEVAGPAEGQADEMITLTIEYVREPEAVLVDEDVEPPTWGTAETNPPEPIDEPAPDVAPVNG